MWGGGERRGVGFFLTPSGHICVVLTFSEVNKETPLQRRDFRSAVRAKIHADGDVLFNNFVWSVFSLRRFLLQARWVNLCGLDLFTSQEGNSSLQKRGVQRYLSGKRMQMQTKLFNKYALLFFFCAHFSFSLYFTNQEIHVKKECRSKLDFAFKKKLEFSLWLEGKRSTTQEGKSAPHQRRLGK